MISKSAPDGHWLCTREKLSFYVRPAKGNIKHYSLYFLLVLFYIIPYYNYTIICAFLFYCLAMQGLVPYFQHLLGGVQYRFCMRYIYSNFQKKHKDKVLKNALLEVALTYTLQKHEATLEYPKSVSEEAYKDIKNNGDASQTWARAFFTERACSDVVQNNMAEYFNSYILKSRDRPIIIMLQKIRILMMIRLRYKKEELKEEEL